MLGNYAAYLLITAELRLGGRLGDLTSDSPPPRRPPPARGGGEPQGLKLAPCDRRRFASWSVRSDDRLRGRAGYPQPLGRIGRVVWARASTGQAVRRDAARGRSAPATCCHRPCRALFRTFRGRAGAVPCGLRACLRLLPRLRTEGAAGTQGIDDRTRIRPDAGTCPESGVQPGAGFCPGDGSFGWPLGGLRARQRPVSPPIRPPARARPLWASAARCAGAPEFTPR
jgi:hypothetical protein